MLEKKEFEFKIKEMREKIWKVDPKVPFSDAKV